MWAENVFVLKTFTISQILSDKLIFLKNTFTFISKLSYYEEKSHAEANCKGT